MCYSILALDWLDMCFLARAVFVPHTHSITSRGSIDHTFSLSISDTTKHYLSEIRSISLQSRWGLVLAIISFYGNDN